MRKKIFLGLLVIVGLFAITGCEKSNDNSLTKDGYAKAELVDLMYKEPKDFTKKDPSDFDESKVINYKFSNEDKKVNLYYDKDTDYSYGILSNDKYEEKTINNITWRVVHDTMGDSSVDTYHYEYNGALYRIEFWEYGKYQKEFDEFMDEVSFK